MTLLSFVNLDDLLSVDRKPFVGVNYHAEQTGVGLQIWFGLMMVIIMKEIELLT